MTCDGAPMPRRTRFSKAELRSRESQRLAILDSYELVEEAGNYLRSVREKRFAPPPSRQPGRKALTEQLRGLSMAAIEYADGNARAAFYLADAAGHTLHHATGMTDDYARCVNGFVISENSPACGLAVAKRMPVITPD